MSIMNGDGPPGDATIKPAPAPTLSILGSDGRRLLVLHVVNGQLTADYELADLDRAAAVFVAELVRSFPEARACESRGLTNGLPRGSEERYEEMRRGFRDAVALALEAQQAGLVVVTLTPHFCGRDIEYQVSLWQPDGRVWAEGSHETAAAIRKQHIGGWMKHRAQVERAAAS